MILISKLISSKKTNQYCILSCELCIQLSPIGVFRVMCFMKITAVLTPAYTVHLETVFLLNVLLLAFTFATTALSETYSLPYDIFLTFAKLILQFLSISRRRIY